MRSWRICRILNVMGESGPVEEIGLKWLAWLARDEPSPTFP
jgi:hypothetical protein